MTDSATPVPFLITAGHPGDGSLNLRFPVEYEQEIKELLDSEGIEHWMIMEFSASTDLWIEGVKVLASAGGLYALASVINNFTNRHKDKAFLFKGPGVNVEIQGYSMGEVEKLLLAAKANQEEVDVKWENLKG